MRRAVRPRGSGGMFGGSPGPARTSSGLAVPAGVRLLVSVNAAHRMTSGPLRPRMMAACRAADVRLSTCMSRWAPTGRPGYRRRAGHGSGHDAARSAPAVTVLVDDTKNVTPAQQTTLGYQNRQRCASPTRVRFRRPSRPRHATRITPPPAGPARPASRTHRHCLARHRHGPAPAPAPARPEPPPAGPRTAGHQLEPKLRGQG